MNRGFPAAATREGAGTPLRRLVGRELNVPKRPTPGLRCDPGRSWGSRPLATSVSEGTAVSSLNLCGVLRPNKLFWCRYQDHEHSTARR